MPTLPLNLVLVRHGQSELNVAHQRDREGDPSLVILGKDRHCSSFPLTELGRKQAELAGVWLRENFSRGFDRYEVSEYVRAMETAALLGLPNANWFLNSYLIEREWGDLDGFPLNARELLFAQTLKMRNVQPFFWRAPNGESFNDLCMRADRILDTYSRKCSDGSVICVNHGELILALIMRIERLTVDMAIRLLRSKKNEDQIWNCQIIIYSRQNPDTGEVSERMEWVRMVRPTTEPVTDFGWRKIVRPSFTNEQLMTLAKSRYSP